VALKYSDGCDDFIKDVKNIGSGNSLCADIGRADLAKNPSLCIARC
jgi:hypothetical protein